MCFRTWQLNRSAVDGVPQDDHAVAEPALLDQLQVQPHTVRKEPLSATHDHGADDHLELVDKTGPYRLRGEFRTVNRDVVLGASLEPPDRVGIELPLDPRPRAARRGKRPGVNDLLGR